MDLAIEVRCEVVGGCGGETKAKECSEQNACD
jgi:hypothetical protein